MTSEATQKEIAALDALLERERDALIEGELDELVGLFDEKKTLIERVNEKSDVAAEALQQLQKKAARNQGLLDSALQGIRSVATRMGTLHRVRQTLDTYDESGQRRTIEARPSRKVEKRA